MDGDLLNDRPGSSTAKDTTDCLPHGDSGDSDEEIDIIGDDGDGNEDLSSSLHSTVSEHCKASTIEQDVRTSSTSNKHPNHMAPCSNDMTTGVTNLLLPKQLPINSSLDFLRLRSQRFQQEQEHRRFQSTQPSAFLPPTGLPATMQAQAFLQNQVPVNLAPSEFYLSPQHFQQQLQYKKLQSMQPYALLPPIQFPTTMHNQFFFQNQIFNSALECLRLMAQRIEKEQLQQSFQSTRSSAFAPPNELTATTQAQAFSRNQNRVRKPTERNADQRINSEEMRQFAKSFKEKRLVLGATQRDVVRDLNTLYRFPSRDAPLALGCVNKLENGRMSLQAISELKPLLERWLEFQETSRKALSSESTDLRGKPRIYTSKTCLQNLKEYFQQNPWPSSGEYENLAKLLNMKKKFVRNWFYNHRLSIKPMNSATGRSIPSSPLITIPVTRAVNTPATSPLHILSSIFRPWERKATIATSDLQVLENDTQHNTKPGAEEIAMRAESLTMDKEVVTDSFQHHSQIENPINYPTSCSTASIATVAVPAAPRLPVTAHGNSNILDILHPTPASTGNDEEDASRASPRIRNQSVDT